MKKKQQPFYKKFNLSAISILIFIYFTYVTYNRFMDAFDFKPVPYQTYKIWCDLYINNTLKKYINILYSESESEEFEKELKNTQEMNKEMNKENMIKGINKKTRMLLLQYHPDKNKNVSKEKEKKNQEKFDEITGAKDKLLEFLKYNVINEDDYNSKVNLFYSRYILILLVLILLVIVCCRLLFVSKHVVYKIIYIVLFDYICFEVLNTLRQFYNKIPNILGKIMENKDDYPLFQNL